MPKGRQAKVIEPKTERTIFRHIESEVRRPSRDKVLFLLSLKAGMRAKEIAMVTWGMVTDSTGQIADDIQLEDKASKGKGGRTIPMNSKLKEALIELKAERFGFDGSDQTVLFSERGGALTVQGVRNVFVRVYRDLGLTGCSSHSGRRTFITRGARRVFEAGGSLRDVQQLAGHSSLQNTQHYIEGDSEAKRKLIEMV